MCRCEIDVDHPDGFENRQRFGGGEIEACGLEFLLDGAMKQEGKRRDERMSPTLRQHLARVADSNSKLHTRFIRIAAGGYNSCKRGLTAASGGCGKSTARQAAPCEEELSSKSAYGGGGRSDAPL